MTASRKFGDFILKLDVKSWYSCTLVLQILAANYFCGVPENLKQVKIQILLMNLPHSCSQCKLHNLFR